MNLIHFVVAALYTSSCLIEFNKLSSTHVFGEMHAIRDDEQKMAEFIQNNANKLIEGCLSEFFEISIMLIAVFTFPVLVKVLLFIVALSVVSGLLSRKFKNTTFFKIWWKIDCIICTLTILSSGAWLLWTSV